jgi:hypothetical protein
MASTPSSNRRWIWFFLILGLFALIAAIVPVWFNARQQLTPEQLNQARRLWQEKGPHDYRATYQIKREANPDLAGVAPEAYTATVRGGRVISATTPGGTALQPDQCQFGTMDSLFDFIEKQLNEDEAPGKPRAFVKATFDPTDGHILDYVHSVMRTRERFEVKIELVPRE